MCVITVSTQQTFTCSQSLIETLEKLFFLFLLFISVFLLLFVSDFTILPKLQIGVPNRKFTSPLPEWL